MYESRVTILVGHLGSGKTEIAIHGAQALRRVGRRVVLVDLDVVKPYFRSRSVRAVLAAQGIEVIAPQGENIFADLPILHPAIRTAVQDAGRSVIVELGVTPPGRGRWVLSPTFAPSKGSRPWRWSIFAVPSPPPPRRRRPWCAPSRRRRGGQ